MLISLPDADEVVVGKEKIVYQTINDEVFVLDLETLEKEKLGENFEVKGYTQGVFILIKHENNFGTVYAYNEKTGKPKELLSLPPKSFIGNVDSGFFSVNEYSNKVVSLYDKDGKYQYSVKYSEYESYGVTSGYVIATKEKKLFLIGKEGIKDEREFKENVYVDYSAFGFAVIAETFGSNADEYIVKVSHGKFDKVVYVGKCFVDLIFPNGMFSCLNKKRFVCKIPDAGSEFKIDDCYSADSLSYASEVYEGGIVFFMNKKYLVQTFKLFCRI